MSKAVVRFAMESPQKERANQSRHSKRRGNEDPDSWRPLGSPEPGDYKLRCLKSKCPWMSSWGLGRVDQAFGGAQRFTDCGATSEQQTITCTSLPSHPRSSHMVCEEGDAAESSRGPVAMLPQGTHMSCYPLHGCSCSL